MKLVKKGLPFCATLQLNSTLTASILFAYFACFQPCMRPPCLGSLVVWDTGRAGKHGVEGLSRVQFEATLGEGDNPEGHVAIEVLAAAEGHGR